MSKKSNNASCLGAILALFAIGTVISLFTTYAYLIVPAIFLLLGIISFYLKRSNANQEQADYASQKYRATQERTNYLAMRAQMLRRSYDISIESQNILNTTKNVETALSRYSVLMSNLSTLASATEEELSFSGLKSKADIKNYLDELEIQKDTIINQAIYRAYNDMINKASVLKTEDGRQNRILCFRDTVLSLDGLSDVNRSYVNELIPSMRESAAESESYPLNTLHPSDSHVDSDKDILLGHRIFHVHPDLEGMLWFSNGPLKNITRNKGRAVTYENGVTLYYSDPMLEPSALNPDLQVKIPKDMNHVEILGYYPSYEGMLPSQRGKYLKFLENPYQEIDIGYVFVLYYGLERHLVAGEYKKAFDIVLKLRDVHRNKSFQQYSSSALIYTAVLHNSKELMTTFIQSLNNEYERQIPFEMFIFSKLSFQNNITPAELMQYARSFAFTNRRYMVPDYTLFEEQLANVLLERYDCAGLPISLLSVENLPMIGRTVFSNPSFEKGTVEVPDISAAHEFIQAGAKALQEAHDRVKKLKQEMRKNASSNA